MAISRAGLYFGILNLFLGVYLKKLMKFIKTEVKIKKLYTETAHTLNNSRLID